MIDEVLEKYDTTITELADYLGVSQGYLSNVKNGKKQLTFNLKEQLEVLLKNLEYFDDTENYLAIRVDFLHVNFKEKTWQEVVTDVLQLKLDLFHDIGKGLYGYKTTMQFENIKILVPDDERLDMGCLLVLSGSACRTYEIFLEEIDLSWDLFFAHCFSQGGKFTRVDIAIDDYLECFKIPQLIKKYEQKCCDTRFQSVRYHSGNIKVDDDGNIENQGATIYFGTRQSKLQFCFYQKNYELAKKQQKQVDDFKIKNRYELRFREDLADNIALKIVEVQDMREVSLRVIAHRLQVYETAERQELWKDWLLLVKYSEPLKITSESTSVTYEKMVCYALQGFGRTYVALRLIDETMGLNFLDILYNHVKLDKRYKDVVRLVCSDNFNVYQRQQELLDSFGIEKGVAYV